MNVTLRRSVAAAAVVLAAPLVSACAPNFDAPTDQVYNPGVGVNDRSGTVDVLHTLIVSGEDGSGTVVAGLVNGSSEQEDRLASVSGAGDDLAIGVQVSDTVTIPPGGLYQLAENGEVTVTGTQIQPGQFISLTFNFEQAQSITVEVPVVSADNEDFADVPLPQPSPL